MTFHLVHREVVDEPGVQTDLRPAPEQSQLVGKSGKGSESELTSPVVPLENGSA